jgi:hypothetical protein
MMPILIDQFQCEKHGAKQYFGEPCLRCHEEQWSDKQRPESIWKLAPAAVIIVLIPIAILFLSTLVPRADQTKTAERAPQERRAGK